jgi:hypothetical protein
MYQLTADNTIQFQLENGGSLFLPATNNGTPEWRSYQAWLDAGNTPEPAPEPPAASLPQLDYQGFYDALLTSRAYQTIRAQAVVSLPLTLAAVEFIAAMGDAKLGKANVAALQACLGNIAATATDLDAADWAEIGGLLVAHGLDGLYQLPEAAAGGSGSGG